MLDFKGGGVFSTTGKCIIRDVICHKTSPLPSEDFHIKERAFRYSIGTLRLLQWFGNLSIDLFWDLTTVSLWCLLSSRLALQFTLEELEVESVIYLPHVH